MAQKFRKQKPRSLTQLIGADWKLLKQSGSQVLFNFYWAAFGIVVIFVLTFFSVFYAMEQMFHLPHVEIVFSIFFSLLFCAIYVFLLNTISKQSLEINRSFFGVANLTRLVFLIFMAFLISKPIEVFLLNSTLQSQTKLHQQHLFDAYTKQVDKLFYIDEIQLDKRSQYLTRQLKIHPSAFLSDELKLVNEQQRILGKRKERYLFMASSKIENADFFLYKIKLVSSSFVGWLIFLVLLVMFLAPGYLIYSISEDDIYYKSKKKVEADIILNSYSLFLDFYSDIFKRQYGANISFVSRYDDPPFNTKLPKAREYKQQKDLMDKLFPTK